MLCEHRAAARRGVGSGADEVHPSRWLFDPESKWTKENRRTRASRERVARILERRGFDQGLTLTFRTTAMGQGRIFAEMDVEAWEKLADELDT